MGRILKSKNLKFGAKKRSKRYNLPKSVKTQCQNVAENNTEEHEFSSNLRIERESTPEEKFSVEGRRIIDIAVFYRGIQEFKHNGLFKCTIENVDIVGEKRYGLRSVFFFKCKMCFEKFSVQTSEEENSISNVNYGAVLGVTSTGGGYSTLEEITGILNIPCMSSKTYNDIRKKVGQSWVSTAQANMAAAAEEEKQAAIERGDVDTDGVPLITVVTDGCWSKRSYRNNYSALSGAAAIVGFHTKKIIFLSVKNKFCVICETAKNKNVESRDHVCTANYNGPSTGMEATAIVEGFKYSEEMYGLRYNKFIADGDSAVYKKLLDSRPYANIHIQKIECRNHLFRNLRSKLRDISKNTRFNVKLRNFVSSRSSRIIIGIKMAISHWKSRSNCNLNEKIMMLSKDIRNSPDHVFGCHSNCASYFCSKVNEPENRIKEMKTDGIFTEISSICNTFSFHAKSLIHDVDSNVVEHFHSTVCKFVGGKRLNFSMSDSYTTRCHAALVHHNSKLCYGELSNIVYRKSPNGRLKRLMLKRKRKNLKKLSCRKKLSFEKRNITVMDGNYGSDTCQKPDMSDENQVLLRTEIIEKLKANQKNRVEIEKLTRDQANCNAWHQYRRNLLTASNFGKVCKRRVKKFGNLVKQILYSDLSAIRTIEYGKDNEERALRQLERQLDIEILKCGLFIDEKFEFLGASPDGLVGETGIVEVKCPSASSGMDVDDAIREKKITFWKYDKNTNDITVDRNHLYYYQVQGQLNVTRRELCYFAVWTSTEKPLKVEKIYRDESS